jgi:hypothetical protein
LTLSFASQKLNHGSKRHISIYRIPMLLHFAVLKITGPLDVGKFTGCVGLGLVV